MTDAPDEMLTVAEVCIFFGGKERPMDQSTVYRWVQEKRLAPPIRIGHRTNRWRLSDCKRALDEMQRASLARKGYGT